MRLVLYSKPGCCLCEGLEEKLRQIPQLELEVRDITTHAEWMEKYEYTIPVLMLPNGQEIPRIPPRSSVPKITEILARYQ